VTDHPLVSAIVLNWKNAEDTLRCVGSLEAATYPNLRIVIVDNGSGDGSVGRFRTAFPRHEVIGLETNGGYAKGNNEGIRHALKLGAEFLLVINNDVVVEPGFLEPMVDVARSDERVGLVTCKAFFSGDPGRIYCTGGHIGKLRCSGRPLSREETGRLMPVGYVSGCVFLVRRQVLESVGFMDESFFMYFEDFEYSRRVGARFTMMYTPEGVVHHRSGGGDTLGNYSALYFYYNTRNRLLAFEKDHWLYRAYVVAYSLGLAFVKTCYILLFGRRGRTTERPVDRVFAIWKGLKDGLLGRRSGIDNVS